ncbi:unnamed protein product [Didymodactylos carnosus]|uniref:VPS9 domain-containing protein n=1 Tax=Didymodactylos carnosus TaxID=1234261 RepID=A0A814U8U0_9BILA|nr:unnamed protein product [Didymodactylos carnosus]CAF3935857.1 unnamed protein product [Didymodactylos carnosus]
MDQVVLTGISNDHPACQQTSEGIDKRDWIATLPIKLLHRILEQLDAQTILFSLRKNRNLIRLSSNSVAGANDTIPILIFLIIKTNPPSLLPNLQYVQDLHSCCLTNEESYNWTMFVSAVRFVCELIN